jgi:hypothetical protein
MEIPMHVGGCACGGVRYEVEGELEPIQLCHCSVCRKASGTAFAANIPVRAADFRLTSGEDLLRGFESSPGKIRTFCSVCGSPLHSRTSALPGVLRLRAGTLDAPVAARPGLHIYATSKADWWEIADDLPRYPGSRPS